MLVSVIPFWHVGLLMVIDLFKSQNHNSIMKSEFIRTSIDLPRDLHRRLHEKAARSGCSARQIVLRSIEFALDEPQAIKPKRRLSLDTPIVPSSGKRFDLSDEEIYNFVELA